MCLTGRRTCIPAMMIAMLSAWVWMFYGCMDTLAGHPLSAAESTRQGPQDTSTESLRNLLIDLAEYNACSRLKGKIFALSSENPKPGAKSSAIGILRIDSCSAVKVAPRYLRVDISGQGWQWVSQKKERLGAVFGIDQNVRFDVDISMTGTFDIAYDQKARILTVWFVPVYPVEASLRVKGSVSVDNESLWSAIVGTAGTVLGQSPEETAKRSIRKQGAQRFSSRLAKGFTLIVSLCNGEHFMRLGTFPAGELPKSSNATPGRVELASGRGVLYSRSLLMSGPYDAKKPIVTRIDVKEGGGVRAWIACENDARSIADAYANGKPLPELKPLAETTIPPGNSASLRTKAQSGCKVVLIVQPLHNEEVPVTFDYETYQVGAKPKAYVGCNGK